MEHGSTSSVSENSPNNKIDNKAETLQCQRNWSAWWVRNFNSFKDNEVDEEWKQSWQKGKMCLCAPVETWTRLHADALKGSKSQWTGCQERGHPPNKIARVIFGEAATGNVSESGHCGEKVRSGDRGGSSGTLQTAPLGSPVPSPSQASRAQGWLTAPPLEEGNRLTESLQGVA